jgi:putative sigma-54 modulation protein
VILDISGRGVFVSAALTRRVEAKVAKASRVLPSITEARVVLARERHRHLAEVTLLVKGAVLRAEAAADDFHGAVDLALANVERQVRRRKERIRTRQPRPARRQPAAAPDGHPSPPEPGTGDQTDAAGALFVRRTSAKPMSVDEALEQLRVRPGHLLVFTNAESRVVNVLHRRSDGTLELVEPGG